MKLILGFMILTAVFTSGARASAMDQESFAKCLPQVESLLGKPATSKAPVYELSAVHAMELEFDKECEIVFVRIVPKCPSSLTQNSMHGMSMNTPSSTE